MDIVIYTSDPENIDAWRIEKAVEALGYFVANVTVVDRGL